MEQKEEKSALVLKEEIENGKAYIFENQIKDALSLARTPYVRNIKIDYIRVDVLERRELDDGTKSELARVGVIIEGEAIILGSLVHVKDADGNETYCHENIPGEWGKLAKEALHLALQ